jgi:hypothetical protein
MMQWLQTILLIILVDRNLILRDRYRFGIECNKPTKYGRGWFAFWIYCKKAQGEYFMRDGGKCLFSFKWGKELKS